MKSPVLIISESHLPLRKFDVKKIHGVVTAWLTGKMQK